MSMHIGIDVGGTFTDAVAMTETTSARGKALSTKDVTGGILAALAVLQDQLGLSPKSFYPQIDRFVLGNTIVTNAIDEMRLAKTALLTTAGFKDTLSIARSARGESRNPHDHQPLPMMLDRRNIVEITERVDARGDIVVALDEETTRAEITRLVEEEHIEAIAVCLLWSFRNPKHERAIGELIHNVSPHIPVTLSSGLTPVYREYERMVTTVLDASVKPLVADHFAELEKKLVDVGLRVRPQIMQVHGGFLSIEDTARAPINMFNSGPVGGVVGARLLGNRLGRNRILTADMGGTSLDAAAIIDGELRVVPRANIGPFPTSLTAVDIETIGAGGGSLGHVDERGLLRVGPHSAGSRPGPVAYGRGGEEPTITDAGLVLGLINPDYYLGGAMTLDREAACKATHERLGERLGMTTEEAARGMYRLAVQQMANAVRKITINRGHDPRDFTMVNFGGAMGLFAAEVAREVGVREVVIPENAAVFSAWGLMYADAVFAEVRTSPWDFSRPAAELEAVFAELEADAYQWFEREDIAPDDRELVREADMKFLGQIFEITCRFPNGSLTEDSKSQIRDQFIHDYEAEFGSGTAWAESPIALINARIRAVGRAEVPVQHERYADKQPDVGDRYEREVVLPASGERRTVPVYRSFRAVGRAEGPCLLEEIDTTVWVPDGAVVTVNDHGDVVMDVAAQPRQLDQERTGEPR